MDRYEFPSVLSCVEDLHGHVTGASDPLSTEDEAKICQFLRMRLETWQPSCAGSQKFDDAVRHLILTAVYEFQGSHWAKPKPDTGPFRCTCGSSVFMRIEQTPGLISRKCITCGKIY